MARPSKLTTEIQERLFKAIHMGLTFREAARCAGIDETTFYNWKRKGKKANSGPYHQFFQSLKKAEVIAEAKHLKVIHDASAGGQEIVCIKETIDKNGEVVSSIVHQKQTIPDWKASAWLLERRYPEKFRLH